MTPHTTAATSATLERLERLERVSGLVLEEQTGLTLADLCRACAAQGDVIIALVDEGVLTPIGQTPEYWRFTGVHMHRARVAVRLQRDLGINLAGAALALHLMDEMETLRAQLRQMSSD